MGRGRQAIASCFRFRTRLALALSLAACGDDGGDAPLFDTWLPSASLPEAVSNNAVASIDTEGGCMLFSLAGIGAGRSDAAIHKRGFRWREGDDAWISLPELPGPPRVAASAVGLRGEPYVLGGYEVNEDGSELSIDTLHRFDLGSGQWVAEASLPIAIDDAAVVAWRDRYIVVVSGWSNTGNVPAVQIYDAETDAWSEATSFPGRAVFGHSAAIAGDSLVVIDGVTSGIRGFELINQAWRGILDPNNPEVIVWEDLGTHAGPARYRAAAAATGSGELWFHGGSSEPYNYDGLRYDNDQPATPLATTLVYREGAFDEDSVEAKPQATMDHRTLVRCGPRLLSVGGMSAGPEVTDAVWSYLPAPSGSAGR